MNSGYRIICRFLFVSLLLFESFYNVGRTQTVSLKKQATPLSEFGIWISPEELSNLPISGEIWENLQAKANDSTGTPNLSDQNDNVNVLVMAKALVFVRTGDEKYRDQVIEACMAAIGTEQGGKTLSLGRELAAYVIAADLVSLPPDKDQIFRHWLRAVLSEELDNKTLRSTHELRPNNWGTHCGGSRAAVAAYLKDETELERVAQVFKGWLGDRNSYAGFKFGNLSWQADSENPVGINPRGAMKDSFSLDGVLPDDQRRAGEFIWPPPLTNYVYEALQGALLQAVILYRSGYDVWNWEDKALLRAFQWLHQEANFPAEGDDTWQPYLINYYYGTKFPSLRPSRPGKNVGWTDWTHEVSPHNLAITGQVKSSHSGLPVDSVTITLTKEENTLFKTTSDIHGKFSVNNIPPGLYSIVFLKEKFKSHTEEISIAVGYQISTVQTELIPDITTGIRNLQEHFTPSHFQLQPAYPNPFFISKKIVQFEFFIGSRSWVSLSIYDILGRRVRVPQKGILKPGWHKIAWQGKNDSDEKLSPGVYIYRLTNGKQSATRKLLILR